eukprot:364653-Chlamydomonas_euryale.AAC.7
MFFTFKLRPKQAADRLLCLAVVTRHHLLLSLRTRLLRPGVAHGASPHSAAGSARARIPHRASPLFPAPQPLQPREAVLAAAACPPAAYHGPASA